MDTNIELNAEVNPRRTIFGSRMSWDQYLKLAAIPYAFGFLTVMLHTARYGFPVVQILEPLNFWVGAIPSLLLLILWKGFSLVMHSPWEKQMLNAAKTMSLQKRTWFRVLLTLLVFTIGTWLVVNRRTPVSDGDATVYYLSRALICIFVAIIMGSVMRVESQLTMNPRNPTARRHIRTINAVVFSLFITTVLFSYLKGIYGLLPQRYGFGKPANVRLILDSKSAPAALLEVNDQTLGPTTVSRKVQLLYRTGDDVLILCDKCDAKSLSIRNSSVVGIMWDEARRTENLK
jgi:hypothetical protein